MLAAYKWNFAEATVFCVDTGLLFNCEAEDSNLWLLSLRGLGWLKKSALPDWRMKLKEIEILLQEINA